MLIALPTFSTGATVTNELRSFESVQPRAVSPNPRTEPPLHGTNPHGQGTAAVIDLAPSAERPYAVDSSGNAPDEDIIVGRSRGEQRADGTYHGHITVASAFGNEIIGRDTLPGQRIGTAAAPEGIATNLLTGLCTATGICLGVAEVYSETTATGSFNTFSLARAALGGTSGVPAVSIAAARSTGNITSDGTCQTASGSSQVADVDAGGALADVSQSTSQSQACRGAAPTQTNTSTVINLRNAPLGLPFPGAAGCTDGTPDTVTGLPTLLPIVCNADDSSATGGTQAVAPADRTLAYGVRHALDVYVLATATTALAQVSTAQSESLAVSPAAVTTTPTTPTTPTTTTPTPAATTPAAPTPPAGDDGPVAVDDDDAGTEGAGDDGDDGDDGAGDDGDPGGAGAGAGPTANLGGRQLPFTGTDVVVLGLAGSILLAAGLTLRGPARRRELGS